MDASGYAYVTGKTASTNFPNSARFDSVGDVSYDVFVTKLDTTATGPASLIYSTYLGGGPFSWRRTAPGIAIDSMHRTPTSRVSRALTISRS